MIIHSRILRINNEIEIRKGYFTDSSYLFKIKEGDWLFGATVKMHLGCLHVLRYLGSYSVSTSGPVDSENFLPGHSSVKSMLISWLPALIQPSYGESE